MKKLVKELAQYLFGVTAYFAVYAVTIIILIKIGVTLAISLFLAAIPAFLAVLKTIDWWDKHVA